jgi:hypothetical protein
MRKVILVLTALMLSAGTTYAHENMTGREEMGEKMEHHGMHEKMMGMMKMGMMEKPQMVASNDGGVIILAGHKLYKYDKNLNLVKEVDLKTEGGMCPMKDMMKENGAIKKESDDRTEGKDVQEHSHQH